MKKIPYGISDYETLITEDYCYVDKTMYLEKLENAGYTLKFLRPRRFGKTLFTSMMQYYYDINSRTKFDILFKDTYVYNNPTVSKNNYYVLKFDFSGMTYTNDIESIKEQFNKKVYNSLYNFSNKYNLNIDIDYCSFPNIMLADLLTKFGTLKKENKIYIIIDEYDDFTNGVLKDDNKIFKDILGENGFVRSFYSIIKEYSGSVIDRTFITGVCSISLDSMSSGFNISSNISNKLGFNSMLGLTHEEVKELIKDIEKKEEIFNILETNYDGYLFNEEEETRVFNSNLVMYFLKEYYEANKVPNKLFDSNIVSSYEKIKNIIMLNNNNFYKEILDSLFYERSITGKLKDYFNLNSIINKHDIISLLYYFGYITIEEKIDSISYKFKIPNKMMELVYNEYYLSIITNSYENDKFIYAVKDLKDKGSINLICNYVSDIIKNADNKIYTTFNERSVQLIFYSLLAKYNEFDTYFEYQIKDKYIDLMIFKKKDKSSYDVMIEFKYIKKKDYNKGLLNRFKSDGIEQLKEYDNLLEIDKSNLRKYIVIYVGSDVKVMEEVL